MLSKILLPILIFCYASISLASAYDNVILQDHPVLYLPLSPIGRSDVVPDLSGNHLNGHHVGLVTARESRMPNGDYITLFDGRHDFVEVTHNPLLSVPTGGILTIEAWIRPDTLEFPMQEGDGYVHWAGKGQANAQEYALRIYARTNAVSRPNRISAYAFNLSGGLGSGSYFQDPITRGEWIHVAAIINTRVHNRTYPTGYVRIYKNADLRDTTALNQFDVRPGVGIAPLRIGTRDLHSFFKGAIGKFALYNYELTAAQLQKRMSAMVH